MCKWIKGGLPALITVVFASLLAGEAMAAGSADARAVELGVDKVVSIARGGRLYDKWYKMVDKSPPGVRHEDYPAAGKYAAKTATTWRCKECHGWDGLGKDGAYAGGKHYTGIKGVKQAVGRDPGQLVTMLEGHGYGGLMSRTDLMDLANFLSIGQLDMDAVIDRKSKTVKGADTRTGAIYYQTLCAQCHGATGITKDMPILGKVANSNPWETLHKILNGQPAEEMPALRALNRQVALDILAYLQTLPKHGEGHHHHH